jgi:hypothetical protein
MEFYNCKNLQTGISQWFQAPDQTSAIHLAAEYFFGRKPMGIVPETPDPDEREFVLVSPHNWSVIGRLGLIGKRATPLSGQQSTINKTEETIMQKTYVNDRPVRFIAFSENGRTQILFIVDDAARVFGSTSVRSRAKFLGDFVKEDHQGLDPDLLLIHQDDLMDCVGDLIEAAHDLLPIADQSAEG